MISIMISKSMEELCDLLNKHINKVKTPLNINYIFVDKFDKNYVGWVYIYCKKSKTKKQLIFNFKKGVYEIVNPNENIDNCKDLVGNVVIRLWCSKTVQMPDTLKYMIYYGELKRVDMTLSDFEHAKRFIACANCMFHNNDHASVCFFNSESCPRIAGTTEHIMHAPTNFLKVHVLDNKYGGEIKNTTPILKKENLSRK